MARRTRGVTRRSSAANKVPSPQLPLSDEEGANDAMEEAQDDEEPDDADTPAQLSDQHDENSNPPTPPTFQSIPRKRRPGRPPKVRPPDWDTPEPAADDASDTGTPAKRRRGRPSTGGGSRGGFRGRLKKNPPATSQVTQVAVDKEGTMMDVVDDEVALPDDAEGETKVDKNGVLLEGREYRVRVFTIIGRGDRLYMLSTEPARCTGFRDSYLFFTKHMLLHKIIIDDNEKRDLISRDLIPHSYKGRSIGVVTARSVFREFGSKIVVGGRKIVDDYQAQAARDRGDGEGELADPNDRLPGPGEPYNKNQYVAWHGASSVYHNNQPSVPLPSGKPILGKRKATITSANWMFEHAREASRFNAGLAAARKNILDGVYDPHTNVMCYPKTMQHTHVKWEEITPTPISSVPKKSSNVTTDGTRPWDGVLHDTEPGVKDHQTKSNHFVPVPSQIARNFLVVDTYFQAPPHASFSLPGPGSYKFIAPTGLPDIHHDDLADLPQECQDALREAKHVESAWRNTWSTESKDGARARLKIGFGTL